MVLSITFATQITLLRILLTPCVVMAIFNNQWVFAFVLSIGAAITDLLDGYYARHYNQETELGKMMDPVADKIFIFMTLWALHVVVGKSIVPTWFMIVLCVKELLLVAGAYFLIRNKYGVMSPSIYSKWVTALLMVSIVYLILIHCYFAPIYLHDDHMVHIFKFFTLCIVGIFCDYGYKVYKLLQES